MIQSRNLDLSKDLIQSVAVDLSSSLIQSAGVDLSIVLIQSRVLDLSNINMLLQYCRKRSGKASHLPRRTYSPALTVPALEPVHPSSGSEGSQMRPLQKHRHSAMPCPAIWRPQRNSRTVVLDYK